MNTRKRAKLKIMSDWERFVASFKAGTEWSIAALAIISTILIVLTSGVEIPPEIFIPVVFGIAVIAQAVGTTSNWAKSFKKESDAQEKADIEEAAEEVRAKDKAADQAKIVDLMKFIQNLEKFAETNQQIVLETKHHVEVMHHDHEESRRHEMSIHRDSHNHLAVDTGPFSPHSPITPSTAPAGLVPGTGHHIIHVNIGSHSPHDPHNAAQLGHAAEFIRALSAPNIDPATVLNNFNPASPPPLIHAPTAPLTREHSSSRVHADNSDSDKQDKNNHHHSHHSHHRHGHSSHRHHGSRSPHDHHQTQHRNSQPTILPHPPKHTRHQSANSMMHGGTVELSQNHSRNSQILPHGRDHSPSRVVSQSRSQLQLPRGRNKQKEISPDNHNNRTHQSSSTAAMFKAGVQPPLSAPVLNPAHHFNYNVPDQTIMDGDERNSNTSTSKVGGDNARESSVSGIGNFSRRGSINKSVQVGHTLAENNGSDDSPNTDDNTNDISISRKNNG